MSETHIATRDGQKAVYQQSELIDVIAAGRMPEDAVYWQLGMSEWKPVAELIQQLAPPGSLPPPRSDYQFVKDPSKLTSILTFLIYTQAVVSLFSIFSDLAQFSLLGSPEITETAGAANDARQQIIGLGYLLVYLVTTIVFLTWINRANKNCHGFSSGMKFTSGWSVGWYFIPFANLVKPFQVMNEIWRVSHDPVNWKSLATPAFLRWWWGLWLAANIFGQVSFRMAMNAETLESLQNFTVISMISSVLDISLCIVAALLVGRIFKAQVRLVASGR